MLAVTSKLHPSDNLCKTKKINHYLFYTLWQWWDHIAYCYEWHLVTARFGYMQYVYVRCRHMFCYLSVQIWWQHILQSRSQKCWCFYLSSWWPHIDLKDRSAPAKNITFYYINGIWRRKLLVDWGWWRKIPLADCHLHLLILCRVLSVRHCWCQKSCSQNKKKNLFHDSLPTFFTKA